MNKYLLFKALCHLPKAIYFNFHYLPFHQAIKMPILFLSKVKLAHTQGTVQLFGRVRPGMVFIGGNGNVLYQQATNCCVWANYGGKCIFGSKISFCDGVALEIGQHGTLTFNDNIYLGPMVRVACYDSVIIGANSRIAWESIILDTDFHSTIDKATGEHSAITKPIVIGKNNWIGIRCLVMKGTQTPDFCIASAYSLLNKKYDVPNYSLIGGIPAKFLKEGLYRDLHSHVNDIQQEHYAKSIHSSEKKKQNRETKFVVSLVVPTYKPGGYIEECLASLGAQTLNASKFEVIIVLNGCDEPWRSQIRAFIDRHLSKHCVRLIQTNVAGVSNARNIGIEEAQGEFIGFLDDDDYVSPSYLEELSGISTETCVGLSDSAYFEDGGDVLNFDNRQHCIFARYSSGVPAPSIFNVRSYFNGPVMKILHRDIIGRRRFDIRFKNSEDSLFMTLVSDKIESVRFTSSSAVYYRRIRRGSATTLHRTLRQKLLNQMRVSGQVCGYWIKNPVAYNLPFILSRFAAGIKSLIVD